MAAITSVSGFPRIGAHRELKRAIEGYWKGERNLDEVRRTAADLRSRHWQLQQEAGVDLIPVNDFSYYDQVLDTSILLGVVPERYRNLGLGPEDTLFAMGRGYQGEQGDVTALPMKKWFTTNYHYLVPEIDQDTRIALEGDKPFKEFQEAREQGIAAKPVLIGPYTFLKLARGPQGELLDPDPALVRDLARAYATILERFISLGADWVQLDEPYLVLDKEQGDLDLFGTLYEPILNARESDQGKVRILLNTYFGHVGDCYDRLAELGFDGIGLDLVEGRDENLAALKEHGVPEGTTIFAGLVNGRNIWRNDYAVSLGLLDALHQVTSNVVVSTACSLLHVPYTVADEDGLDADTVRPHFAFALEKLGELHDLARLADADEDQRRSSKALADNQKLFDGSRVQPDPQVQQRLAGLKDEDFVRTPARPERQRIQARELGLPLLPTTTIGSFPQTAEVRAERARLRKKEISQEDYDDFIARKIDQVIDHQEQIGLDVLVHGEFERNDMVEYFGQNLKGYLFTRNAWVQSYGTRCVKPPIVWGDISRARPITVRWSSYAQSRTNHVVKGMLTGPVTILNWSWPREDIDHKQQTQQLALAIRDEVLDLEAAGIRIIQIDEAALREKLPLRRSDWHSRYLDWAIPAFRLVHSGVKPTTQIHTHMCYSEFNDIIKDIDAMDADVISFEASRSDLTVLDAIQEARFETEAGPGVYDIHSPRVPSTEEIVDRIHAILKKLDAAKVWINPDCGLKTRNDKETWPSLEHMVAAAHQVRAELSSSQESDHA
ncbi:5-methyltetrahydropteroyltriglutamate--homocysteine S-methyltransferase [Bifidobacterium sp. W8109]|uniref:5-methyltetrahydropteroyltriglutamate-- homocysteine S-methyltransferase n=1 Tax=Bifidobacterium TaxID=1678 RepID=UPI0018DB75FB|nr:MULTISPECIES: 5-methyltetrahydropteroyltriglutamate--homocysteine S-methyltransferase [Bifidobacterium]MBH9971886.1 5-methyltetrahydropteroyltriglutamate--homocysteine S-methyltransferase [Bifidobacterium asteroides]MBI0073532.1 5-methyltetrahydropteroyltriglutamate--homocysteine S-methyltransferase [Bifidobacterium sp. W8110]